MEDFPLLTEALAHVIKKLRADSSLSQRKLAEISGVDRVYLLQIEQGKFRPTLNAIFLLARAFSIQPETLVKLISAEIVNLKNQ